MVGKSEVRAPPRRTSIRSRALPLLLRPTARRLLSVLWSPRCSSRPRPFWCICSCESPPETSSVWSFCWESWWFHGVGIAARGADIAGERRCLRVVPSSADGRKHSRSRRFRLGGGRCLSHRAVATATWPAWRDCAPARPTDAAGRSRRATMSSVSSPNTKPALRRVATWSRAGSAPPRCSRRWPRNWPGACTLSMRGSSGTSPRHRYLVDVQYEPGVTNMPVPASAFRWRAKTSGRRCYAPVAPRGSTATTSSGSVAATHPRSGPPYGRGRADHRRWPLVGRGHRRLDEARSAARRYRGARRGLHGSGRDRDRQRPDPRRPRLCSPSNRLRCEKWRRWSRAGYSRLRCSPRWRGSWRGVWMCTTSPLFRYESRRHGHSARGPP